MIEYGIEIGALVSSATRKRSGLKKAPPGGRGEVGPGTLKMASALPRLELGRLGSLDGLHFIEFALPLCACGARPRAIAAKAPSTRLGETDLSAAPAIW